MQKASLAGGTIAAVVALSAGAYVYLHNRIQAEVEAPWIALRASGLDATHGPVTIDLLRRSVNIRDVTIKPTSAGIAGATTIDSVMLEGIGLFASNLSANHLSLSNLTTSRALADAQPGLPASIVTINASSLTARDVRGGPVIALPASGTSGRRPALVRPGLKG